MYKLINSSKLLVNAIALTAVFMGSLVNSHAQTTTLQILHASDFEAGLSASSDAPNFAAVVDALDNTYANTLILSSGDNFIPSPFSFSGEDATMVTRLKNAYIAYYGSNFANNDLRAGIARPDISILNFIGVEAAVLGNHEFDLGTSELKNVIAGANSGSSIRWFGANFPYLSSNLNFSNDPNLSPYFQSTPSLNTTFMSNPTETAATIAAKKKLASSTIIEKNGIRYGIVGVTTPILEAISSPGFTTVNGPGAGTDNMALLASIVQPFIDNLINNNNNNNNCDKIILLAHLQQLTLEKQLATYLNGVDIIIAGGSHTLMADSQDRLRAGDTAVETYPFFTQGADGNNTVIINTAAEYKYVGRLVIDFDSLGNIIPASVDPLISGAYATDEEGVLDYYPTLTDAFAAGTKGGLVKGLTDGIAAVITTKDGNTFGKSDVYLQGLRNYVRTQETNLGDITADANLWQAKQYNSEVKVSLKNGGGIRSSMGVIYAVGDSVVYLPTAANPAVGKEEGEISQLDIENCLRFNNQLSVLDVTATGMKAILEHSVAASGPGQTQGRFPQISGMQFSFNLNNAAQSRIINAAILDDNGNVSDTIVHNGSVYGNPNRVIKMVTLNFLATGGDSYPFVTLGSNRVDLVNVLSTPGSATFALPGSEQDAFAEFMSTFYNTNAFSVAETPVSSDFRIQDVNARQDLVLANCASLDTTEVVYACQSYTWNGTTYTNSGTYTHAATSPEGCTYTETLVLTIQTNAPSIPTIVTGAVYACDYLTSGTTTYSTPAVAGSTFEWVAPTGMTIVSGQGTNSITVSFGSAFVTSNLKVRAVNGCGSSAYKFFQVKRLAPATPASLTSTFGKACPGDAITFTSATMPGATSYNWTAPAGATVTTGQETNIATITFNSGFTATGIVSVTASNGCGVSIAKTKTMSLNTPLTPSVITGTRTVSQNQTAVPYSVVNVAGMSYNWTVASNFGSIATGQGNNAITVNATNIIGTGYTMSVRATNACGTSPVRAIANLKIVAGSSALQLAETSASQLEKTDLITIVNVAIFPNPASDFVTLQLENIEEGTVAHVTIFDLTGKQVFNMQSNSNLQTIDVSQFARGMYVIHVNTATENFVQKLQVK